MASQNIEPFTGRRGTDIHGCRFHLDPTPLEFERFFAGLHGAAFISVAGHVAFGAGPDGSIDHPSIARAFGLAGDEAFRGYLRADRQGQLEIWVDAWDEDAMTDDQRDHVAAATAAFLADTRMVRLLRTGEIIVFGTEHGQPIIERPLDAASPAAAPLAA